MKKNQYEKTQWHTMERKYSREDQRMCKVEVSVVLEVGGGKGRTGSTKLLEPLSDLI